jgi:hypothetical protein
VQIRGVALPWGADKIWIRVGERLDPSLGGQLGDMVEAIVRSPPYFHVQIKDSENGRVRHSAVLEDFVTRVELLSGEVVTL